MPMIPLNSQTSTIRSSSRPKIFQRAPFVRERLREKDGGDVRAQLYLKE